MTTFRPTLSLISVSIAAAASLAGVSAFAADDSFVAKAAIGGMTEVDAGGMAQQKGASNAVKDFGQKMVQDHTKANDELKQIATSKNITVPPAPDAAHKKAEAALGAKSGLAFDRAFKAQMIADHKTTIALFENEANKGSDPELKAFAAKTLPDLRSHLQMAQTLP